MRFVVFVAAVSVGGLACGSSAPPTAPDGGWDASDSDAATPPPDGDAGPGDSGTPLDTSVPDTSPPPSDSSISDTSPPDASICPTPCTTTTASECTIAYCNTTDAVCAEALVEDGASCGEMAVDICVAGTCVARGCGDGYREPGPTPAREGCDDGNMLDGDACSSTCEATTHTIFPSASFEYDEWPAHQGNAVAADGRGELLFVWAHDHIGSDGIDVFARRHSPGGVAIASATDPLVLDDDGNVQDSEPQVAGLVSGGWVVVWNDDRADGSRDVSYRIIAPDGALGPRRTANQTLVGPQYQARVAALDEGFVIVWTNFFPSTGDPGSGVRARRFTEAGAPLGDEEFVTPTRVNNQNEPRVASQGDAWIVLWTHSATAPGARPTLYGRRYQGGSAIDAAPFVVSSMMEGTRATVAALGGGAYAAAWAQTGDVYARVIPSGDPTPDPTMLLTVEATPLFETHPSIAALGGSDFLVVYEAGTGGDRRFDFATSPGATLPMEAADIRAALGVRGVGRGSVSRAPNGLWFVWAGGVPSPGADSLSTHFLAID